jgi:hypothetical protein
MIAKGNLHAHGGRLATYMMAGKDGEHAELIDKRGFLSEDLRESFCTIQAIAESQTRCQKPFFHAYVRLPDDEALERDTWLAVADRIEGKLGFNDQPRAVALHVSDDGERHLHVAWSRIDTDDMRAIDPGLYKNKMTELARELEQEFGLRELSSERDPERQTKAAARPEFEEARRLGVNVEAVRETIRDCYDRSDDGPSFAAALVEHDLTVTRGDRRDFVVVDQEGGMHALGKGICGVTAGEIRARLGEEFKQGLPGVDEARAQIEARREAAQMTQDGQGAEADLPTRAMTPESATATEEAPRGREQIGAEVTELWAASDTGKAFVSGLSDARYHVARGDRRDFVLLDEQANTYGLARMIDGAKVADVRTKMADVDVASLPTVAEAKAQIEAAIAGQGVASPAAIAPEYFDRDAADADWQSKVDAAGIERGKIEDREARRAKWIDDQAKARPATPLERRIAGHSTSADNGTAFLCGLGAEGYTLARATKSDEIYCKEVFEQSVFDEASLTDKRLSENFCKVYEGELVAVHRSGGIHQLNPHKIDSALCEALVLDGGGELHSIETTRGDALAVREAQAERWTNVRADIAEARMERATAEPFDNSRTVGEPSDGFELSTGILNGLGSVLDGLNKIGESVVGIIDGFMGGSPALPASQTHADLAPVPEAQQAAPTGEILPVTPDLDRGERNARLAQLQQIIESTREQDAERRDREDGGTGRGETYERERTR